MKDIWEESMSVKPCSVKFQGAVVEFLDSVKDVPPTTEVIKINKLVNNQSEIREKQYKEYPRQTYLDEFLSLKCCGDVLNVVNPIGKNAQKEISESMAIIKQLKKFVLRSPMKYNILDLCAGNALTSVLAVHLLPVKYAYAVDKRERKREWNRVKRFEYVNKDITERHFIYDCMKTSLEGFKNTIIISSHPCKLARTVAQIYHDYNVHGLIMIPCCEGALKRKYPEFIQKKLGKYGTWCWDLAQDVKGKIIKDTKCLSPKNVLIVAERN